MAELRAGGAKPVSNMTHASLFSGIGGFDLAAEWAGWTNAFNCEIDPFCRQILKYHFSNATQYADIRTTNFTLWRDRIDVLTGGFPCQPFSLAGKRRGTADGRHLWPQMLRAIREIRSRWVVAENVLGIVNWSNGMVFEQVCADLENAGYEVESYLLPACGVGAVHRRYRVWFVAHCTDAGVETMRGRENGVHAVDVAADAKRIGSGEIRNDAQHEQSGRQRIGRNGGEWPAADACGIGCGQWTDQSKSLPGSGGTSDAGAGGKEGAAADADSEQCDQCVISEVSGEQKVRYRQRDRERTIPIPDWQGFPTESPICCDDDGFSARLDGITFPRWCRESIKAYGNAIVPQVVLQIFETINEYEKL